MSPHHSPTPQQRLEARNAPDSPVVMRQEWNHLLMLHWEFPVAEIQAKLPPQLTVDTFEGRAYLGIVPFFMEKVRPVFAPCVPGLSWFQELNVRTYVHDARGHPGVWFFSLDCNQWLAVKLARKFFHLPYEHAKMSAQRGEEISYRCQRRGDSVDQLYCYPSKAENAKTAAPESLEFFLLERYRLFSVNGKGQLYEGMVHHHPYEFCLTSEIDFSTRPLSLAGFSEPQRPPESILITKNVKVKIHPLQKSGS